LIDHQHDIHGSQRATSIANVTLVAAVIIVEIVLCLQLLNRLLVLLYQRHMTSRISHINQWTLNPLSAHSGRRECFLTHWTSKG